MQIQYRNCLIMQHNIKDQSYKLIGSRLKLCRDISGYSNSSLFCVRSRLNYSFI